MHGDSPSFTNDHGKKPIGHYHEQAAGTTSVRYPKAESGQAAQQTHKTIVNDTGYLIAKTLAHIDFSGEAFKIFFFDDRELFILSVVLFFESFNSIAKTHKAFRNVSLLLLSAAMKKDLG